jgi:protein SCO1/2
MPPITAGRVRARVLAAALTGVACLALAGCGDAGDEQLNGAERTPPSQVGGVTLPDHENGAAKARPAAMRAQDGLLLVYFGYTSCPDICPTSMADLGAAIERLPQEQRRRLEVGMVTVDPKRDTGTVLNGYLGHFFPGVRTHAYRTTDTAELARAEEAFGASHELGEPDAEGAYEVSHTAQIYAVDRTGTVVVEWPFGAKPEDIADDVRTLLDRT